ncbi:MAG: hypothetical protein IJ861_05635 [Clostridia bacterium]|nr:hypothetical protein [Clostridia bacterium]
MREEDVTKAIIHWLTKNRWKIVCFDFPQSGTGIFLHPNNEGAEKNKNSINPDIVAVRDSICVFFENKDRFYYPDYEKINRLIVNNNYSNAIDKLLSAYSIDNIYYGIGLPIEKHKRKSQQSTHVVDFIIGVSEDKDISVLYEAYKGIF